MIRGHLVTVLGREIPVRSAAPEEKVREVEAFVNERIEAIRARLTTADPQLLVTLALLNLSESYLELQHRQDGSGSTLETRLTSMLEQLDNAL
ncbi:cell division protein ZapA [Trichlorobacter lovleyi]|uniref:cell division protein ZapA n=1 Tax=Trichlorobacter lovleyi TaxID=313985 RepID=UPI0023F00358|nr:cell division protein ZapA [Trichlorobacter lovleyi]